MRLYEATAVWRTERNRFVVPLPNQFCDILFADLPSSLYAADPSTPYMASQTVLARLAHFTDVGLSSQFRLVVSPYQWVSTPKNLFRIRGRLANEAGAMFVMAWLIEELLCLRFLSTSGIDAMDGRGFLDVVVEVNTDRLTGLLGCDYSRPDEIARFAYAIKSGLKEVASRQILDQQTLLDIVTHARKRAWGKGGHLPATAAGCLTDSQSKWAAFHGGTAMEKPWMLIPDFEHSDLSAAPYSICEEHELPTIEHQTRQPILRIESAFATREVNAFVSEPDGTIQAQLLRDQPASVNWALGQDKRFRKEFQYLSLSLTPWQVSTLSELLPSTTDYPSFAVVAVYPLSGTLSIHFKQNTEVLRTFSMDCQQKGARRSLSDFVYQLYAGGFDLRTLNDQHSGSGGEVLMHQFTADVSRSKFHFACLGDRLLAAALPVAVGRTPNVGVPMVSVASPLGVHGSAGRFDVECACISPVRGCPANAPCKQLRRDLLSTNKQLVERECDAGRAIALKVRKQLITMWITADRTVPFGKIAKTWRYSSPFAASLADVGFGLASTTRGLRADSSEVAQNVAQALVGRWRLRDASDKEREPEVPDVPNPRLQPVDRDVILPFDFGRPLKSGQNGHVIFITLRRKECPKTIPDAMGDMAKLLRKQDNFVLKILEPNIEALYKEAHKGAEIPKGTAPAFCSVCVMNGERTITRPGVLMEKLSGMDIEDRIKKHPHDIGLRDIASWLLQAACLLQKWNDNCLVHWDIKPGNLYVTDSGEIKILDFGLMGVLDDGVCRSNLNPRWALWDKENWRVFGSKYHIPPEILEQRPTTEKSTVYGLGTLACHLLGDPNALETEGDSRPNLPVYARGLLPRGVKRTLTSAISRTERHRPSKVEDMVGAFETLVAVTKNGWRSKTR